MSEAVKSNLVNKIDPNRFQMCSPFAQLENDGFFSPVTLLAAKLRVFYWKNSQYIGKTPPKVPKIGLSEGLGIFKIVNSRSILAKKISWTPLTLYFDLCNFIDPCRVARVAIYGCIEFLRPTAQIILSWHISEQKTYTYQCLPIQIYRPIWRGKSGWRSHMRAEPCPRISGK